MTTFPGAGFGCAFFFGSSSSTRPSCTFFFFPSKSSSSDFSRLVLPCRRVARLPLNSDVPSPFVSPLGPMRNCTAFIFSMPGFTVTSVLWSPIFFSATGTACPSGVSWLTFDPTGAFGVHEGFTVSDLLLPAPVGVELTMLLITGAELVVGGGNDLTG